MRNIKFRAWDKITQRMIKYMEVCFDSCGELSAVRLCGVPCFSDSGRFRSFFRSPAKNEAELMQYTGIKDKNGKEIYEGDIVEFTSTITGFEDTGIVGFGNGSFCINKGSCFRYYKWEDFHVEIIGNKFENPDLVSKTL